ncbi:hypothetical protein GE09DRAFT_1213466 [Coniochaeta sp. 2T2.1]|nr:hypothetical protein GE09DRAFT_1213466 [Coniochaeta sp. 2T2.1]
MSFPVIWPKAPEGPGRILEVSVYYAEDQQGVSHDVQASVASNPGPRQSITGPDPTQEKTHPVLRLADWASASDYETHVASRPTAAGTTTTTHLVPIPGGPATTPPSAWYMVSGMRTPDKNKPALAASLDAYLRGIFHCGEFAPVFHHVGVSLTDPEVVLSVQGWPSKGEAEKYWFHKIHWDYNPAVKDLMVVDFGPFQFSER